MKASCFALNSLFCKFFDKIIYHGIYPDVWANAIIVPLHKAGDCTLPENYRAIALLSNFAKLFDIVVMNRIREWDCRRNIITKFQFAYRPKLSTTDAIFCLYSLIEYQKAKKTKLFTAMVDLSKAFDTVDRNLLFSQLEKYKCPRQFILLCKNLYSKLTTSIENCNLPGFKVLSGVQQGAVWSPFLFSILINELPAYLEKNGCGYIDLDGLKIFCLIFADDIILIASTADGLQRSLNLLYLFC